MENELTNKLDSMIVDQADKWKGKSSGQEQLETTLERVLHEQG